MKILVDTPIWSYAFRSSRSKFEAVVGLLETLISDQRVAIIGPIRQEILSGYSDLDKFTLLKEKLAYFPDTPVLSEDYIEAARFSNLCRCKGVQGSHTDYLICSVSARIGAEILTTDNDFLHYSEHIPIHLHQVPV